MVTNTTLERLQGLQLHSGGEGKRTETICNQMKNVSDPVNVMSADIRLSISTYFSPHLPSVFLSSLPFSSSKCNNFAVFQYQLACSHWNTCYFHHTNIPCNSCPIEQVLSTTLANDEQKISFFTSGRACTASVGDWALVSPSQFIDHSFVLLLLCQILFLYKKESLLLS